MTRQTMQILILLLTVLLPVGPALAQESAPDFSREPIQITADRLEADDARHRVTFLGDVVARQGDVVIYAQQMDVLYQEESREVERVEALRDVRIVQGTKVATGDKGVFYRAEGRLVLTGSPRVHQGEDFVEGDEVTVFLNEERSIVSSEGGSRVNAIFHPKESP